MASVAAGPRRLFPIGRPAPRPVTDGWGCRSEIATPRERDRFLSFGWTTKLLPRSTERLVVNSEFSADCSSILGIKSPAVAWPEYRSGVFAKSSELKASKRIFVGTQQGVGAIVSPKRERTKPREPGTSEEVPFPRGWEARDLRAWSREVSLCQEQGQQA